MPQGGSAPVTTKVVKVPEIRADRINNRSIYFRPGGMAEWSKAAVLKTVEVNASVGSNPTPSANKIAAQFYIKISWYSERTNAIVWGIGFQPRFLIDRLESDPTDK